MVGLGRIRRLGYALAQLGNGLFRLPTRKEDAAALNPCHNVLGSHPQNFLVEGRSFRDAAGLKIYLHHAVLQVRVFGGSREAPAILGQGAVGILVLHVEVAQRKRNRGALVLWVPQFLEQSSRGIFLVLLVEDICPQETKRSRVGDLVHSLPKRSEERRVGKECRSG